MTDVQVSNARRIGFTALALVAFWVLAWKAYGIGFEDGMPGPQWNTAIGIGGQWNTATLQTKVLRFLREYTAICFAIPPAILLSLAIHSWPPSCFRGQVVDHRDWRMLISIILFIVSIEVCYRLGESDASAEHEVSWPWLLLPILTSAFVIFGAWRRAVRDAAVEAADEEV